MGERLSPIGFWSYARQDDEEKLGQLRVRLSRQLQQQYGRQQIKIFQDVAAIPPGAEWEAKILDALNTSTFFIPIITPNFLESEWCNKEFFIFREREKKLVEDHPELAGHRRIFPIYYVDIEGVKPHDPALLPELKRLQWLDFTALIYKDDSAEEVQVQLGKLARSLRQLLHLEVQTEGADRTPAAAGPEETPPHSTVADPPGPKASPDAPGSFWSRLTAHQKSGLAWGVAALVAIALIGAAVGTRRNEKPTAAPAPMAEDKARPPKPVDPRLAAANLMVGSWRDQDSADGCDGKDVSVIALAKQAGPDAAPRLELKNNGAIGVLNAEGFWVMDGGLWRARNGSLELRAEGSPSGKFDLLIQCPPTEGSAP